MKTYPAYTKGRPTYQQTPATPGAYLISYGGKIQYVGFSGYNVVKTAYRHFQNWNDPRQYRATFPKTARILIIPTRSAKRAKAIEETLIAKYNPTQNTYYTPDPLPVVDLSTLSPWAPDDPTPF